MKVADDEEGLGLRFRIRLYHKGYAVAKVCHTPKEETSLSYDHGVLDLTCKNVFSCESNVRHS